jgi:hypothetical protein
LAKSGQIFVAVHAFDRSLFRRSFGIVVLLALIGLGVMIATDEVGSTPRMRLSRLVAFVPGLVAIGEGIVLAQARTRGEIRAMTALGASPFRAAWGACVAGWCFGFLGLVLLLSPLADPAPLFPAVVRSTPWVADGAALVDPTSGARVGADGLVAFGDIASTLATTQAPGRWAAFASVFPIALVTPVWAACPLAIGARLAAAFLAVVIAIVTLHAVAAGGLPTFGLTFAALPLMLQASWSLGRTRNP